MELRKIIESAKQMSKLAGNVASSELDAWHLALSEVQKNDSKESRACEAACRAAISAVLAREAIAKENKLISVIKSLVESATKILL